MRARVPPLDSYQGKVSDSVSRPEETRAAERDSVQRRKRPKPRKAYDLDSEGEETSDESSSEKVCVCVFGFGLLAPLKGNYDVIVKGHIVWTEVSYFNSCNYMK